MSMLFALGLGTGICCGIWALISNILPLGLITWIGFAGCTAYFACGKHGFEGVKTAFLSTLSGLISAVVAMFISNFLPGNMALAVLMTGIISATMCWQAKAKQLWFIPGAFIGCFSSFAAASSGMQVLGVDFFRILLSFICGTILALSCDMLGNWIFKKFGDGKIEDVEL